MANYYLPQLSTLARALRGWPSAPNSRPSDYLWKYSTETERNIRYLVMPHEGAWRYYERNHALSRDFLASANTSRVSYEQISHSGSGSYGHLESTSGTVHSGNITLFVRVKLDGVTGIQQFIGADNNSSGRRDFQFRANGTSLQLILFNGNTAYTADANVDTGFTLSAGVWYNIVARYFPDKAIIWVNGVEVFNGSPVNGATPMSGNIDSDQPNVVIGGRVSTNNSFATLTDVLGGDYYLAAIGNGAFSDGFCIKASRDIFAALFEPINDTPFLIGVAGGAGTITGTGSLSAQTSSVSGTGVITKTGTSSFVSTASSLDASGTITKTGTGAFNSTNSSMSASGAITRSGTGDFSSAVSQLSATGTITKTGTAAFNSGVSTLDGTGTVVAAGVITGTGDFSSQNSSISGTGVITRTAVGDFIASTSQISGTGVITRVGTGAFAAGVSTLDGVGTLPGTITGTATFVVSTSTLSGVGLYGGWSAISDEETTWTSVTDSSTSWTEI